MNLYITSYVQENLEKISCHYVASSKYWYACFSDLPHVNVRAKTEKEAYACLASTLEDYIYVCLSRGYDIPGFSKVEIERYAEINYEQVMNLFFQYDDPVHIEHPADFSFDQENNDFKLFHTAIEKHFGVEMPYETGTAIQDASYHSVSFVMGRYDLYFSNFGKMISFYDDGDIPNKVINVIIDLSKDFGYNYIPARYAQLPYSGVATFGLVNADISWGDRFFNFI